MTHKDYMQCAFDEAYSGMRKNEGGPFGAVIVQGGEIIGRGHNRVTSTNDPTAHAEIVAIREACKKLNVFHLPDAVLYASCEPCPMCLAAIYWANIKTIYYCYNRNDAAKIGFSDEFIYDEINKPISERTMQSVSFTFEGAEELFHEWNIKPDKIAY